MLNKKKMITATLLLSALFLSGTASFLNANGSFSSQENRTLTVNDSLTSLNMMNGSFQNVLTDLLSDQYFGRNLWMTCETVLTKWSGRQDIGDTFLGKDHYYFEKVTDNDLDEEHYLKNLQKVDDLAEKTGLPCKLMLVPSAGIVLSDLLPENAPIYHAEKLYQDAEHTLAHTNLIDPTSTLSSHMEEQLYYRTDHHWTSEGAYYAYLDLMGSSAAFTDPEFCQVSDDFYGTLYSRTLDPSAIPDSIDLANDTDTITVKIDGKESSLYDWSALNQKDQYQVFEGGNHGLVELIGKGEGTLVVIKDSFANSMAPYLTADYQKIFMVDLRYYAGSVLSLIQQENADEILVLYELNNFAVDTNLAKLYI